MAPLVRPHLYLVSHVFFSNTYVPGAPGWAVFVQPLLADVNPSLASDTKLRKVEAADEIIDVKARQVFVQSSSLELSLQRLRMLVLSNPSSGLCRRITAPILLQLWVVASLSGLGESAVRVQKAARDILQTCFRLFGTGDITSNIIPNLLSKGSSPETNLAWEYQSAQQGGIEVVAKPNTVLGLNDEIDWNQVQEKAATLVEIMTSTCSTEDLSSMFLDLFQRWVKTSQESGNGIDIVPGTSAKGPESPVGDLVEITILQQLLENVPEKLVSQFDQLQDLICHVFRMDEQSRLADEPIAVILSLLNLVVTAPTFKISDLNTENLKIVEQSLDRLARDGSRPQVSQTASNIALLLKYRSDEGQDDEPVSGLSSRQIEDRRVYNLAMNYITGTDNPPPVVSEGLNLLSGLIATQSSILDVTAVNVLLSNLLSNNEDYINLRVVKMFTQLAEKHPKSTIRELVDHYLDPQEKANTDTRLRFGEALLQVIERLGETFTGEAATHVCETLLSIAGRRGYRPKTMAKQSRDEKLKKRKMNHGEAEDDLDMESDDRTEEERARDDILAQIVQGWDSKRGSEDIRMRASALSIFGTALETNITGIGATMVSNSVDLCINILTLEPEMEKSLLRRAAILVVLGFVRALEEARNAGRSLGFGLTDTSREDIQRTLQYISSTDNDGLVQQHAKDVFESLEAWQMATLLPQQEQMDRTGLGGLAGLNINPLDNLGSRPGDGPRPRIEEIE